MGKSFWQSLLGWFAGSAIAVIVLSIVFKIGWENKEHILIWGYGALGAVIAFFYKLSKQMSVEQQNTLNAHKNKIDALQNKFIDLKENIEYILKSQEETHATVDNIYRTLLESNNFKNRRT